MILSGFLLVSLLTSFASAVAIGVSGDLSLYPGQTFDIAYDVMNTVGSQSLTMEGRFLEGSEIVSFSSASRVNVPAGSVAPVPVRYEIPANAPIGTIYNVKVIFRTVSDSGTGGNSVSFVEDASASLKVRVVEPSAASAVSNQSVSGGERTSLLSSAWFWILAIIIVAIVLWLVFKMKRKGN